MRTRARATSRANPSRPRGTGSRTEAEAAMGTKMGDCLVEARAAKRRVPRVPIGQGAEPDRMRPARPCSECTKARANGAQRRC